MIAMLSKIIKLNHVQVVGVTRLEEGERYHVLSIKKKGNTIGVVGTAEFDAIEDLVKGIDAKLPVLLVVDGKGILNKAVDFNSETDTNWHKTIDFNTIYHTSLQNGTISFISFCRKNIVDDLLVTFTRQGLQVADVYIGPFLSALLYHSIGDEILVSGDHVLEFEAGKMIHFTRKPDANRKATYTIGKDVVTSEFLPLYGAVVHFFIQPKEVSKSRNETINSEEIIYKKAFHVFGIAILAGFLLSLLTSYGLIQYYGSKNAALNLQNVYANESYQQLLELEKQKHDKQQILSDSGLSSSKFLSFFAYEIIRIVPGDLILNELNITPVGKENKPNKKITFEAGSIMVKGETYNETAFNTWLEALKKKEWVRDFEILKLKKDKKNKSQFEVKITVKDV